MEDLVTHHMTILMATSDEHNGHCANQTWIKWTWQPWMLTLQTLKLKAFRAPGCCLTTRQHGAHLRNKELSRSYSSLNPHRTLGKMCNYRYIGGGKSLKLTFDSLNWCRWWNLPGSRTDVAWFPTERLASRCGAAHFVGGFRHFSTEDTIRDA